MRTIARISFLSFMLLILVSFARVSYAQWNGIIPHVTTKAEVISIYPRGAVI